MLKNACCLLAAALLLFGACGKKSKTVSKDVVPDVTVEKDNNGETHIRTEDLTGDTGLDFGKADVAPIDGKADASDDLGTEVPELVVEVWTPTSCKSHDDCDDGFCIELSAGSGEFVCAPTCIEECPLDWVCKSAYMDGPDPVSICMPSGETLCQPCKTHEDCLYAGSLCIPGSGVLGYCGSLCDLETPDCPEGFVCEVAKDKDGNSLAAQCMPPSGSCCVAAKLKSCDDKNPCTLDFCDPSFGCQHDNIVGPCDGPEECTNYKCMNGACIGIPVTQDVTLDGIDDDCDGKTDEDWANYLKVPFHQWGSSHGESGGGMNIRGFLSTPPYSGVMTGGDFRITPGAAKLTEPEEGD